MRFFRERNLLVTSAFCALWITTSNKNPSGDGFFFDGDGGALRFVKVIAKLPEQVKRKPAIYSLSEEDILALYEFRRQRK